MRVEQGAGTKGSLKWIQIAVNDAAPVFDAAVCDSTGLDHPLRWLSPLRDDQYAEYRDGGFLARLGLQRLEPLLGEFWPARGPQWDALGKSGDTCLLVEAKAHVGELCSPPTAATGASRALIDRTLHETAAYLGARPPVPWGTYFYQLANRLAHLWFLRRNEVDARLVLVNVLNDVEQRGPASAAEWEAAYAVAFHVLGLPRRNPLSAFVSHVHLPVSALTGPGQSA